MSLLKLEIDENLQPTMEAYGLSTHVRDYRLCWALNKQIELSLERQEDHQVQDGGLTLSFSRFRFVAANGEESFYLLQNRHSHGVLFPEVKHADFIFLVVFAEDIASRSHVSQLQTIDFVNAVFSLDSSKLKNIVGLAGIDGY